MEIPISWRRCSSATLVIEAVTDQVPKVLSVTYSFLDSGVTRDEGVLGGKNGSGIGGGQMDGSDIGWRAVARGVFEGDQVTRTVWVPVMVGCHGVTGPDGLRSGCSQNESRIQGVAERVGPVVTGYERVVGRQARRRIGGDEVDRAAVSGCGVAVGVLRCDYYTVGGTRGEWIGEYLKQRASWRRRA